jgi:hypothetical protein
MMLPVGFDETKGKIPVIIGGVRGIGRAIGLTGSKWEAGIPQSAPP